MREGRRKKFEATLHTLHEGAWDGTYTRELGRGGSKPPKEDWERKGKLEERWGSVGEVVLRRKGGGGEEEADS